MAAYNFTVPERLDIGRSLENVHVRIKTVTFQLEDKAISVEVIRMNRDTFDSDTIIYTITGQEFLDILSVLPTGNSLGAQLKSGIFTHLKNTYKGQITFNGSVPLDSSDINGTVYEPIPAWDAV